MILEKKLNFTTLYRVVDYQKLGTSRNLNKIIDSVEAVYHDTKTDYGNIYYVLDESVWNPELKKVNVSENPSHGLLGLNYYFKSIDDIVKSYQMLIKKYKETLVERSVS